MNQNLNKPSSLLELNDVSFSYSSTCILKKINIEILPGDVVVLLGNNGAGKSTLLKMCAGLLKASSGRVTLLQKNLNTLDLQQCAEKVVYLPQHLMRPEHFPVWQFMQFGSHAKEQIKNALDEFDAQQFVDRDCFTLSGGEWLRVQLARIFVQPAKVILLDEPSAGLDLEHVGFLARRCRLKAQSEQCGIVISTHDLTFALAVATKIFILDQGQCVWNEAVELLPYTGVLERLFHVPIHWVEREARAQPAAAVALL